MSRRSPTKLTRQDHFKKELDRCTRVLEKLNAHSYRSPTSSPRRPTPLLKSHTMTSFDTYINHSPDVSKTTLSSPSLGSFHHGNHGSYLGNYGTPFGNHGNHIANHKNPLGYHGKPLGNHGNTLGNHVNRGVPAWSLSSAANFLGMANGWHSKQSNKPTKSQPSMDTDELCEFLSRKGLGDPREAMRRNRDRRSQEHEDRRQVVKLAERRQRDQHHVTYYLQKLRAQSFLDSAAANSRAEAFCEQQGVRPLRTASATYRTNAEPNVEVNAAFSASGSDASSRTGSDAMNTKTDTRYHKDLFERISAWLEDCEQAKCKEEQTGSEKGPNDEGAKRQTGNELSREEKDRNKREGGEKIETSGGTGGRSFRNALSSEGKPIKSAMSNKTKSTNVNKAARKVVIFLPNV